MTTVEIIRIIGSEFEDVSDNTIYAWIEICEPLVSKSKFGKLYEQALAYLVCHRMKVAGYGKSAAEEMGFIGSSSSAFGTGRISSISDGQSSISFSNDGGSASSGIGGYDSNYSLTDYGIHYLELRRLCVVPITIA